MVVVDVEVVVIVVEMVVILVVVSVLIVSASVGVMLVVELTRVPVDAVVSDVVAVVINVEDVSINVTVLNSTVLFGISTGEGVELPNIVEGKVVDPPAAVVPSVGVRMTMTSEPEPTPISPDPREEDELGSSPEGIKDDPPLSGGATTTRVSSAGRMRSGPGLGPSSRSRPGKVPSSKLGPVLVTSSRSGAGLRSRTVPGSMVAESGRVQESSTKSTFEPVVKSSAGNGVDVASVAMSMMSG